MYAGYNKVLNATTSKGVALVSLDNAYWGPKYAGAKRVIKKLPIGDSFIDVLETDKAYAAIDALSKQKVIEGFDDHIFRPDEPVTRGQAAAIINRVLKLKPKVMSQFKDVPKTKRFAADIAAIREANIISGFQDKTFRPDEYLTRNEMAVIVQRAFKLNPDLAKATNTYSDVNDQHWAYQASLIMKNIDKTGIFSDVKFYGTHRASRAVFSAAFYNSMNTK
ncbi:hypothetical protein CJ483_16270 [Bacillus sp. PK3_68]|nr:hypothetical protein CJ483_16270 [Bacillus sp. PK3_68]